MKKAELVTSVLAVFLVFCNSGAVAQNSDFVGDWTIVTTGFSFVGSTTSYLEVSIEEPLCLVPQFL